jgi:hypothetical protein
MARLVDESGQEISWHTTPKPNNKPYQPPTTSPTPGQPPQAAYPQGKTPTYKLGDDQYKKLGQDAWNLGNSNDFYSKGWLNLGDYGGDPNSKYQFAYDDAQNIGQADSGDLSRWLYVRDRNDPENMQKYNLGNATDPNIDMTKLGQSLYGGGQNMLNDFWGNFYGWDQQGAAPQPAPGQPPAAQPPAGQPPTQPGVQPPVYPGIQPIAPPAGFQPGQGPVQNPGGGWNMPAPGSPQPLTPDDAIRWGMGGAKEAYDRLLNMPQYYPDWWGQDYQAMDPSKWQNQYPEFIDVPTYGGISMPGAYQPTNATPGPYQGLMEGDYDRLEEALRQPGETAAKNAFEQGGNYLKDIMGSSGMYGSSVMGNQANEGFGQKYMDTLASNASNAVGQRYGMQQGDLQFGSNFDLQRAAQQIQDNQFGANYGLSLANLGRQDALDQYKSALTGRNMLADYNTDRFQFDYGLDEAARKEHNALLENRFGYDLSSQDWLRDRNKELMQLGLGLAGQGAPLQQSAWQYQQGQDQNQWNDWSNIAKLGYTWLDDLGAVDWAKDGLSSGLDGLKKILFG